MPKISQVSQYKDHLYKYKFHVNENETEGVPACVVVHLTSQFEALMDSVFDILKKKHAAAVVTRNVVSPVIFITS